MVNHQWRSVFLSKNETVDKPTVTSPPTTKKTRKSGICQKDRVITQCKRISTKSITLRAHRPGEKKKTLSVFLHLALTPTHRDNRGPHHTKPMALRATIALLWCVCVKRGEYVAKHYSPYQINSRPRPNPSLSHPLSSSPTNTPPPPNTSHTCYKKRGVSFVQN